MTSARAPSERRVGYLLATLAEVYGLPVHDARLIPAAARDLTHALALKKGLPRLVLTADMRVAS